MGILRKKKIIFCHIAQIYIDIYALKKYFSHFKFHDKVFLGTIIIKTKKLQLCILGEGARRIAVSSLEAVIPAGKRDGRRYQGSSR